MPRVMTVAAVLAAIAVWIDLGKYHLHHQGDTIVPILTSLYRWTLFYWEDDRFGMVIPLLALPVKHPFGNLMLQSGLAIFAGLASFFAVARCISRDAWVPLGAIAALLYFGGYGGEGGGLFSTGQTYGVALALAGTGLALMLPTHAGTPRRLVLGVVVILAAHWSALTVGFLLGPILIGRWWFELDGTPRRRAEGGNHALRGGESSSAPRFGLSGSTADLVRSPTGARLAIVALAFIASYVASARSPFHIPGRYDPLPAVQWVDNWLGLGRNVMSEIPWTLSVVVPCIAVLGLATGLWRRDWTALRTGAAMAATLASGGALSFLLTGIVTWVKLQDRSPRYATPAVFMIALALLTLGLIPLLAALSERARRSAAWASLAVLLCVCLVKAGPPSLRGVRADIDRTLGMRTTEIIDSGATHIVGTYWNVWPSVYHANLTLYERGSDRKVWGVTQRASPTADYWARMPVIAMRLCAAKDDEEVGKWLAIYRFPAMYVDRRLKTIMLIRQSPDPGPPAGAPKKPIGPARIRI